MAYKKEFRGKKVSVKKEGTYKTRKGKRETKYVVSIGGVGYSLHPSKRTAQKEANIYRKQLGRKPVKRKR